MVDELIDTFDTVGITPNLHKGAADVFRLLNTSPLGAETRETYDKSRTMKRSVEIYAQTALNLKNKKKHAK